MSLMKDQPATPASTLTVTRIVWGGMLLGLIIFGWIQAGAQPAGGPNPGSTTIGGLRPAVIALIALLLGTPLGYFLRLQIYKRGWEGFAVKPKAYYLGNIVLFLILDVIAVLCLFLGLAASDRAACWSIACVAGLTLAINFPNGKPMEPSEPRL